MGTIYFHNLPLNVAKSAFCDAVEKFVVNVLGEGGGTPKLLVHLEVPDSPTSNKKHVGYGWIELLDEKTVDIFMARLGTEPMMFGTEVVAFSREKPPGISAASFGQSASSTSQSTTSASRVHQPQSGSPGSARPASGLGSSRAPGRSNGPVMNLNRVKYPQFEKREVRPPNIKYLRKLRHRHSVLGPHLRLETLEFGVLRNYNFSVEYSRPLIEETGYFIFEDDEKSLRISIGGSHQDSIQPSVAIATQTYMFLALSQNPHFELGDIARPLRPDGRFDARGSRDRLSALDECHERIAPYASRWIKLVFHEDVGAPNAEMCKLAGLPVPEIDPPLSFSKLDIYSPDKVAAIENWFQGGSLDWGVAFQVEALFRNATLVPSELMAIKPIVEKLAKESKDRAADALRTFRAEIQGVGAHKTFNDFENKDVVDEFNEHLRKSARAMPWERIGMSKSSFMCYHVKITPTAVHLNGPLEEQSNRVICRYPG
ncbi:hypothetical protein FRC11_000158, partial [Ceratobasidium sp. 423]